MWNDGRIVRLQVAKWGKVGHNSIPVSDLPAPCFLGQAEGVIDAKQRLAIPAKFRNELGQTSENTQWACLPWGEYLTLHPKDQFRKVASQLKHRIAPNQSDSALWSSVFADAEWVDMDSSGRVVLPKRHLDRLKIGKDVVVLGANHYLELHDKEKHQGAPPPAPQELAALVRLLEEQQRL